MINALFSNLLFWVSVFWFINLVIKYRKESILNNYLIHFFFIAIINYFVNFLYCYRQYEAYCFAENIKIFTSFSLIPIYYFYIKNLTKDYKSSYSWQYRFGLPFIFSAFSFILYFMMDNTEKYIYIDNILYGDRKIHAEYSLILKIQFIKQIVIRILFLIQVIIYLYFGIKHITSFNKSIKEFYSDSKNKKINAIKHLLFIFILTAICYSIAVFIDKSFINKQAFIVIPSIINFIFLFGAGYFGFKQNFSIKDFKKDILTANKIDYSPEVTLKDANINYLKDQLVNLLEEKEVFKNPDLRISDVSNLLNTNRTYISNLVNDEFNLSFTDFINNYRINYAKNILQNKKNNNLSISEIGYMSGFLSESSFYRVFKDKVGVPPGTYRKKSSVKTKSIIE